MFRRYKEFNLLREILVKRFPGLYVPPVPPKKSVGNMESHFIEERRYLLDLFIRQLVRCPYLYESDEFRIFVRPQKSLV